MDATGSNSRSMIRGLERRADQLQTVFEAFEQAEGSTTRRFGGTGLGLTITRHFAEMLQGRLDVESAYGEGSQFTLRLPALYRVAEDRGR